LDKYSADQAVCEKAARGIIDIYKVTNQQDKVGAIAAKYPCANFTEDEQEDIYYTPAMDAYNADEYELSIGLFEKYLANYPNGKYANEVKNYIADAHYQTGNMVEAVRIYRETLEGSNTGFTEKAAARVSFHLYNEEQYAEVIPYYERLEAVSATPEVIFNARLGVMRSAFLTENWNKSANYADKVLTNSSINESIALEAYYAKGMGNYYLKNYDLAKAALVWVIKNTTTAKGAEARYALADSYFQQDYLDNANDEVTGILKQKPAYNYWIAKGLILRSRIYIKQNNLFEAEQTLKSVIEHYPNSDDGIHDEANELWNELMQLKDTPKNVTPDTNPIIEVNDDKDGN
jgi:tetratricopeptide (TPR) repeat protein